MAEIWTNVTPAELQLRDTAVFTVGDAVTRVFERLEAVASTAAQLHAYSMTGQLLLLDLGGGEQLIASGVAAAPGAQGTLAASALTRVVNGVVLQTFSGALTLAYHQSGGQLAVDSVAGHIGMVQLEREPGPDAASGTAGENTLRLEGSIGMHDSGAVALSLASFIQTAPVLVSRAEFAFQLDVTSSIGQLADGAARVAAMTPHSGEVHYASGYAEIATGLAPGLMPTNIAFFDAVMSTPAVVAGDDTITISQRSAPGHPAVVNAGDGNDRIDVQWNSAIINAGAGDDQIPIPAGGIVDGGSGLDSASSGYDYFQMRTTLRADGAVVVTVGQNPEPLVVMTNVERVHYPQISKAFDIDGAAGSLLGLYQGAFGRTPDSNGFGYWLVRLDDGRLDAGDIASLFIDSAEFSARYGAAASDAAFVNALYQNVLHRDADAEGAAYWSGALEQGASRADVLLSMSESPENRAQLVGLFHDGISYSRYG